MRHKLRQLPIEDHVKRVAQPEERPQRKKTITGRTPEGVSRAVKAEAETKTV